MRKTSETIDGLVIDGGVFCCLACAGKNGVVRYYPIPDSLHQGECEDCGAELHAAQEVLLA